MGEGLLTTDLAVYKSSEQSSMGYKSLWLKDGQVSKSGDSRGQWRPEFLRATAWKRSKLVLQGLLLQSRSFVRRQSFYV
ncbi:hypothetical protein STEG23_016493 [Scotinomys teguina]